jgi:ABC-type polysaccharide/polyol phosphate transport system ATPase subunit
MADESVPAITLEGVSKRFRLRTEAPGSIKEAFTSRRTTKRKEFWALDDVSLEIPSGSMYGLVGHNGSGKSTLLRCIAGIYRPTKGRVVSSGRISALLELGSGFHPDLTGRENIYLNAAIIGLSRAEVDERLDEIVEFSGISKFIDMPIKHYSSGMYVRLGFAVAVHVDPEILIIDEVITVGDEEFQRRCFDHLYSLRRKGVTIVVVSHSLGIVQTMCDMAAWLDHGQLQIAGRSVDVVDAYLKQVNEEERLADGGSGDTGADHFGSGEIVVRNIEFRNAQGPMAAATNGEPLAIRLHWEAREPVRAPVFAISLRHENGTVVSSSTTGIAGVDTGTCEGSGWVDFVIDDLPVIAGSYEIFTSILDEHSQHAYYHQDGGVHLSVRAGRAPVVPGLVDLRATWQLGTDAAAR